MGSNLPLRCVGLYRDDAVYRSLAVRAQPLSRHGIASEAVGPIHNTNIGPLIRFGDRDPTSHVVKVVTRCLVFAERRFGFALQRIESD